MSTIITRSGKGSPLTNNEMDQNLINLNTDKLEASALTPYAPLAGPVFTGPVSVPAGASGDQVPQAQEVVGVTGSTGSAKMPSGTTAQRDGSPGVGYTRFNSTLGTNETWNGSGWVPEGIGGSVTVSTVGTAVDVTGLPSYARNIDILLRGWSPDDANGFLLLLGTVDGVLTSGYNQGTCSVVGASGAGLGPLQGFPLFSNVASGIATATIQLRSADGLYWSISGIAGYQGANNCVSFSSIALTKPLTTLRFTKYTGGSCDAGTATVIWRA